MNTFKHTLIQHEGACPAPLPAFMDLPDNYHNIWRREAWRYYAVQKSDQTDLWEEERLLVSERQFLNLNSSLELVTILANRAKPLLDQIYYAPVHRDPSGQFRFDRSWKPNSKQCVIRDVLPILGDKYRICCLPYAPPTEANTIAVTSTVIDYDHQAPSFKIYTGIAQEFLAVAIGGTLAHTPAAQIEAVEAMLAIILIKGLAHALWAFRNLNSPRKISRRGDHKLPEEPCTGTSQFPDLGASVSQFLFGLEISLPRGFVFFPHDESDGKPLPPRHLLSRERLYVDGTKGLEAWTRNDDGFRARGYKLSKQTIKYFFSFFTWVPCPEEAPDIPVLVILLIPDEIDSDETLPSSDDELGTKQWASPSVRRSKKHSKISREIRISRKYGTPELR